MNVKYFQTIFFVFLILNHHIKLHETKWVPFSSKKFSFEGISTEIKKYIRFCIDVCIECFQMKDNHDSLLDTIVLEINPEIRCIKVCYVLCICILAI